MQNLCRKKRQFVPGYYFANDFNDAVNRIGYIFMIYILYHRLICLVLTTQLLTAAVNYHKLSRYHFLVLRPAAQ